MYIYIEGERERERERDRDIERPRVDFRAEKLVAVDCTSYTNMV